MSPGSADRPPGLLFVTDRHATQGRPLLPVVTAALEGGVSFVQVREKDLEAAPLLQITAEIVAEARRVRGEKARVVVNGRLDVALAAKAAGVHLPADGLPVAGVRRQARGRFLVGRSVHALAEARDAAKAGADYLLFGPIFATPGKAAYGEPQGVAALRRVLEAVRVPVWAIGGITAETAVELRGLPLAGVASIGAIATAPDPGESARAILAALA
jgi:thiamine-phosphate pyrophosphorylase